MKIRNFLLVISIVFSISCISCKKVDIPHTERTDLLINELLTKLDSSDIYRERKLNSIQTLKTQITNNTPSDRKSILLYKIADEFANYSIDSSLLYLDKAIEAVGQPQLLKNLSKNIAELAFTDSANVIAKEVIKLAKKYKEEHGC